MRFGELEAGRAARAARLALAPDRVAAAARDLGPLVALLGALDGVRRAADGGAVGVGAGGMPLREDAGPPYHLARPLADFAPAARAGYVLFPRLAEAAGPTAAGDAGVDDGGGDLLADDAFAAEVELGA